MNTFLNIGYVSYLKEFDKCYTFSFSVLPKKKEANTFYVQAVVYKNEWTPNIQEGMKAFIKGNLAKESYTNTQGDTKEVIKLYVEALELINSKSDKKEKKDNGSPREKEPKKNTDDKDYIPF